jgi:GH24 family phage-related lysozyme (muramidase)
LSGGTLTLTWTGGRLQEATDIAGSWTDVPGNPVGSFSVSVTSAPQKFYRVVAP